MEREMVEFRGREFPVKYRHERDTDERGNLKHRGGQTVAFIVMQYDDEGMPLKTIEGEARCCKKDVYNKRMGRQIAKGRLLKEIARLEDPCLA